ncbi:AbiJ-NTD4 domain-containing protein [Sporosarcina sp. 179-K 8C2 HS]|uniref:AbiJ-NTD4 domain-containing protein n=1 Tax=Sporosarcina sp. 179-K 8C2 HS TaxID=3142387 RepID=UPI0039A24083
MRFSERMGFREVKSVIQVDSIDKDLLNGIWNGILEFYYSHYFDPYHFEVNYETLKELTKKLVKDYFKEPLDEINLESRKPIDMLRDYIFDEYTEWYEIYDLVEFIPNTFEQTARVNFEFMDYCNSIFEREVSAYRFVGGEIVQITSHEEIQEIEDALINSSTSELVKTHISKALTLMADRQSPDYRNSMKESISAVECIAKAITNNPTTTLGAALNQIENTGIIEFHPDLKEGLKKIYGYTNDSEGIRHALKDQPTVTFEDAKFMLVSCSTFCNYLAVKATKAGITIS